MRPGDPGKWLVEWRLRNETDAPVELLAAILPHDRFFLAERQLAEARLAPHEVGVLELPVRSLGAPGEEIENAFLILRIRWREREWRVLARLRVTVAADRGPTCVVERVDVQPVGFASGV